MISKDYFKKNGGKTFYKITDRKSKTSEKWKIHKNNGRNPRSNLVFDILSSVSDFL